MTLSLYSLFRQIKKYVHLNRGYVLTSDLSLEFGYVSKMDQYTNILAATFLKFIWSQNPPSMI